jgi:hypothetical protein
MFMLCDALVVLTFSVPGFSVPMVPDFQASLSLLFPIYLFPWFQAFHFFCSQLFWFRWCSACHLWILAAQALFPDTPLFSL